MLPPPCPASAEQNISLCLQQLAGCWACWPDTPRLGDRSEERRRSLVLALLRLQRWAVRHQLLVLALEVHTKCVCSAQPQLKPDAWVVCCIPHDSYHRVQRQTEVFNKTQKFPVSDRKNKHICQIYQLIHGNRFFEYHQ